MCFINIDLYLIRSAFYLLIDAMGLDGMAVNPNGKQSNLTGFLCRSGQQFRAECVIILCLRCSSFPLS